MITRLQFPFVEGADGNLCVAVAHVDKDHVAGFLLRRGQVLFVDAVSERGGCGVVHQTEYVEPSHTSCVKHGTPLDVCPVTGHLVGKLWKREQMK